MEIGKKFLPIGTVVLLKGGKKELMITGYCVIPGNEAYDSKGKVDISDKVFDYCGYFYPEGMLSTNQLFAFNHEQIERVCFIGYQTDSQLELSQTLNGAGKELDKLQAELKKQKEEKQKENNEKKEEAGQSETETKSQVE